MRTAYDFFPLYRSVIGVDRTADLIETTMGTGSDANDPPDDVEKTGEDVYRITLAAAGFSPEELEVTAQPNLLIVAGRKARHEEGRNYLHREIAGRDFERRFKLADYVVLKRADYTQGVLSIDLARDVPEALKPRRIAIGRASSAKVQQLRQDTPERKAA